MQNNCDEVNGAIIKKQIKLLETCRSKLRKKYPAFSASKLKLVRVPLYAKKKELAASLLTRSTSAYLYLSSYIYLYISGTISTTDVWIAARHSESWSSGWFGLLPVPAFLLAQPHQRVPPQRRRISLQGREKEEEEGSGKFGNFLWRAWFSEKRKKRKWRKEKMDM